MKKYIFLSVFLIAFIISSCASWSNNYGKLKILPESQNEVTIQDLIDKWEDYDIYYAGVGGPYHWGIMFDPKNNDTTLVGVRWKKVEDKESLLEYIKWMKNPDQLNEILGPDGLFYGYLSYSYGPVTLKIIDEKKMYVFGPEHRGGS